MKNLFERLKPEIIQVIEADLISYPTLTQGIIDELKGNYFITNLRYGLIISIESLYYDAYKTRCSAPWEAFVS